MATYEFTLILSNASTVTDDLADKLFAAGCDDATPSSSNGVTVLDFSREANDLETAIRSAITDISVAGFVADRVEMDANTPTLR